MSYKYFSKQEIKESKEKIKSVEQRDAARSLKLTEFGFSGMKEMFAFELYLLGVNSFSQLRSVGTNFKSFRNKCYKKYSL